MLIDLSKDEGEDAHKPSDSRKAPTGDAADEGDAAACIICLEPLTAEGEHRVVALKCGHLFGKSCIEVWVRQKKLCPQCKARAKLHDITPLYGGLPKVAAGKAAEELERQLEAARRQQQQQEQENQRLKDMLQQLQRQQEAQAQAQRPLQQLQYQQHWAGPHQGAWSYAGGFQVSGPAGYGAVAAAPQRHLSGRHPAPQERHKNGPWDEEEQQQQQQRQRQHQQQHQQQQQPPGHHDHYTRSGKGSKDPLAGHRRGAAAAAAAPAHGGDRRGGHPQQQHPQQQRPQQQQQQQQRGSGGGSLSHPQQPHAVPQPPAGQQQWQGGQQVGQAQAGQYLPAGSDRTAWLLQRPGLPPVAPPGSMQQARAPWAQGARHGLGEQLLQQYEQQALQQGGSDWVMLPDSPVAGAGGSSHQQHAWPAPAPAFAAAPPAAAGSGGACAPAIGAGQQQQVAAAAGAVRVGAGGVQAVPGAGGGHLDHLGRRAQEAQQVIAAIAAIVAGQPPPPLCSAAAAAAAAAAAVGEEGRTAAAGAAGDSRKRPRDEDGTSAPTGAAGSGKAAAGNATPAAAAAMHVGAMTHPGHTGSQACSQAAQPEGSWPAAAGGRQRLVFHTTPPGSRHPDVTQAVTGCLVDPCAAAAVAGWGEGLQLQQQFGAVGSRACCLDVQQKVLLLADAPADTGTRIRRVSLLAPQYPQVLRLPGAGLVRALAPSPLTGPGGQLAVGSAQRGLLIASPDAGSIVASVPTPGPVWDVAWSPASPCQLLLGLDRGRLGVADLRQPRDLLQLVAPAGPPAPQALHSLRVVVGGSGGSGPCQQQPGPAYQVLAACSGGVYLWDPSLQQQQQQPQGVLGLLGPSPPDPFQLVLPSRWHGGTCESIALDQEQQLLAVSLRSRAGGGGSGSSSSQLWATGHATAAPPAAAAPAAAGMGPCVASHWVLQWRWEAEEGAEAGHGSQQAAATTQPLKPPATTGGEEEQGPPATAAAAGPGAGHSTASGQHQQLSLVRGGGGLPLQQHPGVAPDTLQLRGHTSSDTLTSGCFFRLPCCQGPLFASGDELSRSALVWDCSPGVGSRGAVLQQLGGLPSPLVSIQGGWSEQLGLGLLAAHCQDGVQVWQWEPSI